MPRILCFGDSNTWGADPHSHDQHPLSARWSGVLAAELGPDYDIITEGLPGRTTVLEDPLEPYRNGKSYLIPCLMSHTPLDLVVIMLGTNDLKRRFSLSALDIANGAGTLVDAVRRFAPRSDVLLIAPPPFAPLPPYFRDAFMPDAVAESEKFGGQFRRVATERACGFIDAGGVIASSQADGIHLDLEAHQKLGAAVAGWVRKHL